MAGQPSVQVTLPIDPSGRATSSLSVDVFRLFAESSYRGAIDFG